MMNLNRRSILAGGAALAALPRFAHAAPGGFSSEGLKSLTSSLKPFVEEGEAVGLVTLVYRHGEVAQVDALGWQDREAKTPMARNSIFRIMSMTKPITTVATLMLMEEGKLKLTDSVVKWLPELADMKVLRTPGGAVEDTVPASRKSAERETLRPGRGRTHRGPMGQDSGHAALGPRCRRAMAVRRVHRCAGIAG
jgi:CubicO group peptidase (beta-lactamase class C family)